MKYSSISASRDFSLLRFIQHIKILPKFILNIVLYKCNIPKKHNFKTMSNTLHELYM